MDYHILRWFVLPAAGGIIYLFTKIKDQRTSGLLTTFFVHGVLVLLMFILPGFKNESPFSPEGIEVALGHDIEGGNSGTLADDGSESNNPPPPQQESGDNSLDQNVATDDNSESNVATSDKNKKNPAPTNTSTQKSTTTTKTETKTPDRTVDQGSVYKKKKGTTGGNDGGDPNSSGQGGGDKGNRGDPNGNPDGNPDGTGKNPTGPLTTGISMYGRSTRALPSIPKEFEQEGILKFEITVNREGQVVRVNELHPPTTITVKAQKDRVKNLILNQLKFVPKPTANEEEIGTYTIIFKRN
jgi:protein TonB